MSEQEPPYTVEQTPEVERSRRKVRVVIAAGVGAILVIGGMLVLRAESRVNQVALAGSPKPVTVVEAKASSYRASRTYVGTIRPWIEADVGPQFIAAYVSTVLVRPGAVAKRGDVLATLDCRNASATSQAVAMQAHAIEVEQKAVADTAARVAQLSDAGFAAVDEAEQKVAASVAQQAQLLATKAKLMNAALEVSDCVLRAPFDGEIATRTADPGAFVRPGTAIVSIVDRDIVRVVADVPESDFPIVAPQTPAHVHVLANGKDVMGAITRRSPSADPGTRTVHLEIDLPDPDREIPVGTTADLRIDVGEPLPATELPLYAAAIRGDKASLFVVDGEVAHSRTVPVKGEIGGALFVDPAAIAAGTLVVIEGRALLSDGDPVAKKQLPPLASGSPPPTASAQEAKP